MANELSPAISWNTDSRSMTPVFLNKSVTQDGRVVRGDDGGGRKRVLIAEDATKDPSDSCLIWALEDLVRSGDYITVLGILHCINNPLGYKAHANLLAFGGTNETAMEAEINKKLLHFEEKFQSLADLCDKRRVYLVITITAGTPMKRVVVEEASKMKVTHVILDRNVRKDRRYYREHLDCTVIGFSEKKDVELIRDGRGLYIHDNPRWTPQQLTSTPYSVASSLQSGSDSVPCFDPSSYPEESRTSQFLMSNREDSATCLNSDSHLQPNNDRRIEELPEFSPESGSSRSASSSSSPSGENSFSDLCMPNWPDGISKPVWPWCSPTRAGYLYQGGGSELETIYSSTKILSPGGGADSHELELLEGEEVAQLSVNAGTFGSQKSAFDSVVENADKQYENYTFHLNNLVEGTVSFLGKNLVQPPPLCSICKLKSPELGESPRLYSWEELKAATNDFSSENLIAEGGFSFVYKGTLPEGQVIAIKKLKSLSLQGAVQFTAEVEAWSTAQHRNLVRLLGYCVKNDERALVYEYVCNGSLDQHLSGYDGGALLEWSLRYKIAIGAARGLRYLHEECRVGCILHCDMRPNNILLTHDFTAMVGDFGLAKLIPNVDEVIETQVIGSPGSVAPEYAKTGQVTAKTDVYSFGVVLLELISGRKAFDLQRPKEENSLVAWAKPKLRHRQFHELVDQKLLESLDMYELRKMSEAASLCIKKDPLNRPGMSDVLRILEGDFNVLSIETMRENFPITSSIEPTHRSHDLENEEFYQPVHRLPMLNSTSKRARRGASWSSHHNRVRNT